MPEVEHSTGVSASLPEVWRFVSDMDNWAPFLTGYQHHEKINEDESIWVVKGELGGLTRVAEFKVNIIEWQEPSRVTFVMQGLQEPVTGSGEFHAKPLETAADVAMGDAPPLPASTGSAGAGWLSRLWDRLSRWLVRRATKSSDVQLVLQPTNAEARPQTQISFRLAVQAGGATGPVLNLLLGPMLKPVAEDLAMKIANAIDRADAAKA